MKEIQLFLLSLLFGGTASFLLGKVDRQVRKILLRQQASRPLTAAEIAQIPEIELFWPVREREIHRESEAV